MRHSRGMNGPLLAPPETENSFSPPHPAGNRQRLGNHPECPAPVPPCLLVCQFEDSYLELLADTLESLDLPARGQFLQRYIRAITHLDAARDAVHPVVWTKCSRAAVN